MGVQHPIEPTAAVEPIDPRQASMHVVLRALVVETWPKITALPESEIALIPEPVMKLLRGVFFAGVTGALPHEDAIAEARERADWAEVIQRSQADVLDRLAALADPLHTAAGGKAVHRYNRSGYPVRDFGADLDRVEQALNAKGAQP